MRRRIFLTSLLRTIAGPEHRAYWHVFSRGRLEARAWAKRSSENYLAFQTYWSGMMAALWRNEPLGKAILASGTPQVPRRKRRAHPGAAGADSDDQRQGQTQ